MNYTQRLATPEDARKIAPLWKAFALDRAIADVSMEVRREYDFEQYVTRQLEHPFTYGFVLEYGQGEVVGFLFTYAYDEAPPEGEDWKENPFQSRRVGSVLGLYVQEEHRKPATIKLLVDAALAKGKELKLSDIDLLISGEQTGIHRLLERYGFKKGAIQYTLHYDNTGETEFPSLYALHKDVKIDDPIKPGQIPLRDPKTHDLVRNSQGDVIFLVPVRDEVGEILKSSTGLPIYPTPLRDPDLQEWVFDTQGKLVVCPVLREGKGEVVEYRGIPQFCPPVYERVGDKLQLRQDETGGYVFAEAVRDEVGNVVKSGDGKPMFKR